MKRVIFVSGPYSADSNLEILSNIIKAVKVANELWRKGWVVICPHGNTFMMEGDYQMFIDGNLELIDRSDAVFMMQGWARSKGAVREHNYAKYVARKEVYYYISDVPNLNAEPQGDDGEG